MAAMQARAQQFAAMQKQQLGFGSDDEDMSDADSSGGGASGDGDDLATHASAGELQRARVLPMLPLPREGMFLDTDMFNVVEPAQDVAQAARSHKLRSSLLRLPSYYCCAGPAYVPPPPPLCMACQQETAEPVGHIAFAHRSSALDLRANEGQAARALSGAGVAAAPPPVAGPPLSITPIAGPRLVTPTDGETAQKAVFGLLAWSRAHLLVCWCLGRQA
jgi:hypothetical protein